MLLGVSLDTPVVQPIRAPCIRAPARVLGWPFMNRLGNRFGSVILKLVFGIYRVDPFCGYLAINRNVFSKICWDSSRYGVETEIVAKVGKYKLKYTEIPIPTIYLDKYKGMTIFDTLEIILSIPRLKFQ